LLAFYWRCICEVTTQKAVQAIHPPDVPGPERGLDGARGRAGSTLRFQKKTVDAAGARLEVRLALCDILSHKEVVLVPFLVEVAMRAAESISIFIF
jgi:hypothetical protein